MKKIFTITAASLALAVAATVPGTVLAKTPVYQAAAAGGGAGYTTVALGDNRYAITYTGDRRMKRNVVAAYAMLRAAEYTIEQGYEWFAVLSTSVKDIEVGGAEDMAARTGSFMGNTVSANGSTGSDTSSGTSNTAGGGEGNVQMGPSTGGFGGGDVPPSVLERWNPKKVVQSVLIIQVGKGDEASFPGATTQPPIFDAKTTIDDIKASVK